MREIIGLDEYSINQIIEARKDGIGRYSLEQVISLLFDDSNVRISIDTEWLSFNIHHCFSFEIIFNETAQPSANPSQQQQQPPNLPINHPQATDAVNIMIQLPTM